MNTKKQVTEIIKTRKPIASYLAYGGSRPLETRIIAHPTQQQVRAVVIDYAKNASELVTTSAIRKDVTTEITNQIADMVDSGNGTAGNSLPDPQTWQDYIEHHARLLIDNNYGPLPTRTGHVVTWVSPSDPNLDRSATCLGKEISAPAGGGWSPTATLKSLLDDDAETFETFESATMFKPPSEATSVAIVRFKRSANGVKIINVVSTK